jgi:hypothetical protein
MATMAASAAAGLITYPAEMLRLSFTNNALAAWDFESITGRKKNDIIKTNSVKVSGSTRPRTDNFSLVISNLSKKKQKIRSATRLS